MIWNGATLWREYAEELHVVLVLDELIELEKVVLRVVADEDAGEAFIEHFLMSQVEGLKRLLRFHVGKPRVHVVREKGYRHGLVFRRLVHAPRAVDETDEAALRARKDFAQP